MLLEEFDKFALSGDTGIKSIKNFANHSLLFFWGKDYRTIQRALVTDTHCMLWPKIHKRLEVSISSERVGEIELYETRVNVVTGRIHPIEGRHNAIRRARCFNYSVRCFSQRAFCVNNQPWRYNLVLRDRFAGKRTPLKCNLVHNSKFTRDGKHIIFCESLFVSLATDRQAISKNPLRPRPLKPRKAQARHALPKRTSKG